MWRARFGKDFEHVVRQTAKCMKLYIIKKTIFRRVVDVRLHVFLILITNGFD